MRVWIVSWSVTVLNLSLFCSKCPWDCLRCYFKVLPVHANNRGGGNDHTHTHSPLSSLLTASCRQRQGTKQHHPKGFSGSFLSVAISKSFYKWAHFGEVSAIILLGSHQMTIQLKIHVRVWSYRCSFRFLFLPFVFLQRTQNPHRLCCLTVFL